MGQSLQLAEAPFGRTHPTELLTARQQSQDQPRMCVGASYSSAYSCVPPTTHRRVVFFCDERVPAFGTLKPAEFCILCHAANVPARYGKMSRFFQDVRRLRRRDALGPAADVIRVAPDVSL